MSEGGEGESQDEDYEGNEAEERASGAQRNGGGNSGVTAHGWDEEHESPQRPADPEEETEQEKRGGRDAGGPAMGARRQGVEKMAAVELPGGDEVERGDEEADPAGDEDGMAEGMFEGRGVEKRRQGRERDWGSEVDQAGGMGRAGGLRKADTGDADDE